MTRAAWLVLLALAACGEASAPVPERLRGLDRAAREGDYREVRRLARPLLEDPALERELVDKTAARALESTWYWNTDLPDWQREGLKRWTETFGFAQDPAWSFLGRGREVELVYKGEPRAERLFVHGNWSERGDLSDLRGWKPLAMRRAGPGLWKARLFLKPTRRPHLYHAVARTAPWPRGRAVAWKDFSVEDGGQVALDPVEEPARETPPAPAGRAKLAVIGLDGASWHVILPLVHRGHLPNLGRLWREGAVGTLVAQSGDGSWYPSGPNVYSALTGMTAARHGMGRGVAGGNFDTNWARRSAPFWLIAARAGLRTAAVGFGGTFPPDDLGPGAMVTDAYLAVQTRKSLALSGLTGSEALMAFARQFGITRTFVSALFHALGLIERTMATTYPASLAAELERGMPRRSAGGSVGLGEVTGMLDDVVLASAARLLERDWDLFCAYAIAIDGASHTFWQEIEPSLAVEAGVPGERVLAAYRKADRLLGMALASAAHVLVFSDHGFGPVLAEGPDGPRLGGSHMANGIVAAWGPDIRPGPLAEEGAMADVAPTALYLAGLPAGADMAGRLLADAIRAERLARFPPASTPTHGSGGGAARRFFRALRVLGLLGL